MIKKADLHLETRDYFLTKHRFDISETSIDGVLITTPQPQELDKYYNSEEYLSHDDSNSSLFAKLYRFARKLNIEHFWDKIMQIYVLHQPPWSYLEMSLNLDLIFSFRAKRYNLANKELLESSWDKYSSEL